MDIWVNGDMTNVDVRDGKVTLTGIVWKRDSEIAGVG